MHPRAIENKKLRILYGASHRVLRFEEIPLFIEAGFEVIPVKAHWEIFNTHEPDADNPTHFLYPSWRQSCTLSDDIIEKIQAIDVLKYHNLDAETGKVTKAEIELINEWIDIIYIPNLLPTVPRVLQWFKGLTLFRVYGEGQIMTYDEWAASSGANMNVLRDYDARYAAMLMLYALNGPEHVNILGTNVFHVGPCITKSRLNVEWKADVATPVCNIVLSYIGENLHWKGLYFNFSQQFHDISLRFLGKNSKKHRIVKKDPRIIGIIEDETTFFDLLNDCRCVLDPGTSPFHMHYAPLEAMMMGVPVIFLEDSGLGQEMLRVISRKQLLNSGMCGNFDQAKVIIKRCFDDIEYAKQLAVTQRKIIEKIFTPASVLSQIKIFAAAAPQLVRQARAFKPPKIAEVFKDQFEVPSKHASTSGLLQMSFSIPKTLFVIWVDIIRFTFKMLCPKQLHARAADFVFKTCFPITYANGEQRQENLVMLKRYTNSLENEISKVNTKYNAIVATLQDDENISFSISGEDRILLFVCQTFLKKSFESLTYLNINAGYDNSQLIYLSGGKGVIIESDSAQYNQLRIKRSFDTVLNMEIGTDENKRAKISVTPLIAINEVIKKYMRSVSPDIVFMSINNLEQGNLQSLDWNEYRPTIFCVESSVASFVDEPLDFFVKKFMKAKDYVCVAYTSVSMIFVSKTVLNSGASSKSHLIEESVW